MKAKFYTGVGSRKTPVAILKIMGQLATKLNSDGWVLRSGGADGADTAFEKGNSIVGIISVIYRARDATPAAMAIAAKFHPAWDRCSDFARRLHGRNAFQVLGDNLNSPSRFLVCWTPDGAASHKERSIQTGGTGTAISIADHYGVEIFNLARPDHLDRIKAFINKGGD
jgi:hypothetical protein